MANFRMDGNTRSVVGLSLAGVSVAVLTQPATTTTQPGSPLATLWAASASNAPTLSTASWANGFITFTLTSLPTDVVVGSYLRVSGSNPVGYNGVWLVSSIAGFLVTVTNTNGTLINPTPGLYVSGGTVATSALPNPFLTDNLGNFFFYATAGIYTVQLYGSALPSQLVLADQNVVAGGGAGSVTSVGLSMPAEFSVAGTPVSVAGTLAVTKATQTANTVYAGPTSGGAAQPTFRALVAADISAISGTVTSVAFTATTPTDILTAAITGSPITTAGTLALTLAKVNQPANQVFAGATGGGSSAPAFRALVAADLPGVILSTTTTVLSSANILALLGTPVTLVPAPGVGFAIIPINIIIKFFAGSVAYTDAGGAVSFAAGTASGPLLSNAIFLVTTSPNKRIQSFVWPGATDTAGNPPTDDNAALVISKATNNFAAGNGTATIIVNYLIVSTT
jgi:hypothetical protein